MKNSTVKVFHLTRILPNTLTILALCSGLTGVRFALQEKWEYAVLAIIVAAVFDVLDGGFARILKTSSKFGAELDSLSDAIAFGVAPVFIMYEWVLQDEKHLGWLAVLVFAVCCILRLARFNTMLEDTNTPLWKKRFFTGVPAPAGASLALLPMAFYFQWGDATAAPAIVYAIWVLFVGALMISRLPTFALKGWRVESIWVAPIFVGLGAFIAGLITNTWLTISCAGILYILLMPVSWLLYKRMEKNEAR
ncbi:MAG: phosphatidylcholine/phosphatidylserine synthase [Alphaproteobacteria bacterium]|nr:phosphatidylcholine/phosphatidylserine synthase [Alphaproteobacteria bacterium]MCL2506012.1 phosphatidylcholine/phosphatidylserine synthase [Alphaproteobacteria bacterium]